MQKKSIFKSKTFWVAFLGALIPFVPALRQFINPDIYIVLYSIIMITLRVITTEPVEISFPIDELEDDLNQKDPD